MLARRLSVVLLASCVLGSLPIARASGDTRSAATTPAAAVGGVPTPSGEATLAPLPGLTPNSAPEPETSATPGMPVPTAVPAPARGRRTPFPVATASPAAAASVAPGAAASPPVAAASPARTDTSPYGVLLRGARLQTGVIDLLQKDDDLFLDLRASDLDKTFLIAPVLAGGVAADASAFTGRLFEPLVVRFQRVGRRVLWIEPNENYAAPAGSPAAASLAISTTDSVVNATPILAENADASRLVVSAGFFLTDIENLGRDLGGPRGGLTILGFGAQRPGYVVDPARSYVEQVKTLPHNDEILASLSFAGFGADQPAVADGRSVRLRVHYSIVEAPALGAYRPRYADDRVGYFAETQKQLGESRTYPPFVRYIDRRDATAGPFVYYLTNEIPAEYRETVRSAVLAWNDAFARIGMPNQIVVRDAPADGTFDPDDIRYSTIRWVTGENSSRVAFGPSIDDPRTGQILRSEVVIDGQAISAFGRSYGTTTVPLREGLTATTGLATCGGARCADDDADGVSSASLGMLALEARGATLPQKAAYVRGYLRWVVIHEVGHTLGLSHNFAGSTLYSLAQLHDPAFTARHQLSSSIMDYAPVNLSPQGRPQGRYFQDQIGLYDRWAIRYGYEKLPFASPESERPSLRALAAESTRPEYAFESDQDANGAQAIDPRVNQYDLSNDPLAFAVNQFTIDDQLLASLDRRPLGDDGSYADERAAFLTQIRDYARAGQIVAKYVGGAYVSRDHRGQPGGKPPIRPIPRAVSQRAFALLDRYLFARDALPLSPKVLADLGYDRFGGWGDQAPRPDYPAVELLGELQDTVLIERLLSPDTTSRLEEAAYRSPGAGATMTLEDLFAWLNRGIFDDLGSGVRSTSVVHRNLQRRYVGDLIELMLAQSNLVHLVGYPSDVPVLARQELTTTADALEASLRGGGLDPLTRAHRGDLAVRIRRALAAVPPAAP